MHLCERFKTDILGTSQDHYPRDVLLGCFKAIHWTILQNCMKMQQLIFQYFTQHIWWSEVRLKKYNS